MKPEPLKLAEIAKALNVSASRVVALRKQGMPDHAGVTIEEILAWREARDAAAAGGDVAAPEPVDPGASRMTLDDRIERQKLLVAEAEAVWRASMGSRNANSSKFQTAYNQSLKTLVSLEKEAFDRKVREREFVRRTDAEAVALRVAHLIVAILEDAPNQSDKCNPDNPAKARKALEEWVIEKRNELSEQMAAAAAPATDA